MPYITLGAKYLGRREDKPSMILTGNFNVYFVSKDSGTINYIFKWRPQLIHE